MVAVNEITQGHRSTGRLAASRGRFDRRVGNSSIPNSTCNPPLGRWVQRDPIGYHGGVNLYEYVGGTAVRASDPSGLWYWNNPASGILGHLFYWGTSDVEAAGASAAHAAAAAAQALYNADQHIVWAALQALAGSLFHKYCHCQQIKEGRLYGVNLGPSASGFLPRLMLGAGVEAGVQALVECGAHAVAFYSYYGKGGGAGTPGASGQVNVGGLGGTGVYGPVDYAGKFFNFNADVTVGDGWSGGANGGYFQGTNLAGGPVRGWYVSLSGGYSISALPAGVSGLVGQQNYVLLGVVPVPG